jgi:uncharacterized membrane protein YgcG
MGFASSQPSRGATVVVVLVVDEVVVVVVVVVASTGHALNGPQQQSRWTLGTLASHDGLLLDVAKQLRF